MLAEKPRDGGGIQFPGRRAALLRTELCIARARAQPALPTRVCGCTLALATRVIRKNAGANN